MNQDMPFEVMEYDAYSGWDINSKHETEKEARDVCEALKKRSKRCTLSGPNKFYETFGPTEE